MNGGLLIVLQQIINQATASSEINYVLADYLLRNSDDDSLSISRVADETHISKASVSRFAQSLGYDGFSELKRDLELVKFERDELILDFKATKNLNKSNQQTKELQTEFDIVTDDLKNYSQQINYDEIQKLCELIYNSKDIYIISTLIPNNLGNILQTTLLNAGKVTYSFPSIKQQLNIINQISKDDLALFISLEGSHISQREMTLSITNSGATTVLITQNPEMKLSSLFDYIFSLGEHDIERTGKYKLLMFIEYFSHFYLNQFY